MAATSGGSVSKAWFQSADTGATFDVQYNPTNFKFDKPVSWKEHDDQGVVSSLEFQKVSPATMQCELTFDTTANGSDVRQTWVNKLLELTNPEITPGSGEAAELDKKRPHKVWFTWGSFELLGVIESVNVTYTMFASDGTPLRAKVNVKMKEWAAENSYASSGGEGYYGSEPVKLLTAQAGQTITSTGSDWRAVADANNLNDPINDFKAGEAYVLPASKK